MLDFFFLILCPIHYAPNFEKVGDILVLACPYMCASVCMYSCSRYRLETSCMDVWIPHGKIADAYFWFFPELSPLVKLRPFDKQEDEICKCRISKSIIARNLKLVMLIGDDD